MAAVVALEHLLDTRQLWRGRPASAPPAAQQPTGHAALDAALPAGGWPDAALSEILVPADGVGELALVLPTLARITRDGGRIVLVAPPYRPYAPGWARSGVVLDRVQIVRASQREALWAAEQCLRSGAGAAVLCWPALADDRALRRLQVAAETGQCLGFAFRPAQAARNASPAALRLLLEPGTRAVRVLKCRGGLVPDGALALSTDLH